MKLSIETYALRAKFGDEAAIKMIKDAGFDSFDYSFYWASEKDDILGEDYRERALKLREFADEIGIECNQAHAPMEFGYGDEMNESDKKYLRLTRAIEAAGILGAKNIIIHAVTQNIPEEIGFFEYNRKYYTSFIPYCEKYGVCVSVENLFNWDGKGIPVLCDPEEHQNFVKSLNSKWLNICVDIGHSAITGYKPEEVIEQMSPDLLKALHIHDNEYFVDLHTLPYLGKFDWDKITAALKKTGYSGELTFEIFGFLNKLDERAIPSALKFAEQTGRVLIEKIEKMI